MNDLAQRLLVEVLLRLEEQIGNVQRAKQTSDNDAKEADGPMMSRYNTFLEEAQYLSHAMHLSLEELRAARSTLQGYQRSGTPNPSGRAIAFSVVTLEHGTTKERRCYFLLPASAGYAIELDGNTYWAISTLTPIGKLLLRKEIDDEIQLPGTDGYWTIVDIR